MAPSDPSRDRVGLALDVLRFGERNILNLRERLPTAAEASARAEAWLRLKQAEGTAEVLLITGRGNNSPGGHSAVRASIVRLIQSLRRRGVIARYEEHTPGSLSIELAPLEAMIDAPRRRRERPAPPPPPADINGLDRETRTLLRDLAERSLEALGIKDTAAFVEQEMRRQYSAIVSALGNAPNREGRLRHALRSALDRTP